MSNLTIHPSTYPPIHPSHHNTRRSDSLYLSFPTDHRSLTATVPGTDFVFNASLAEPAVPSDPYSQTPVRPNVQRLLAFGECGGGGGVR